MNEQQILDWTAAEWISVADFLAGLEPHEWDVDSLCGEWTVREVAAHLTLSTRTTVGMFAKAMIRARGDFDRMEARLAKERAVEFSPAELIEQVRGNAANVAKRSPGSGLPAPLADALIHGQDMARPLGRVRSMPVEPTKAALEYVLSNRFYGAAKRLKGIRLVATDCDWSAGAGDEVRGPIGDILLVATGRPAGMERLTGRVDSFPAPLQAGRSRGSVPLGE